MEIALFLPDFSPLDSSSIDDELMVSDEETKDYMVYYPEMCENRCSKTMSAFVRCPGCNKEFRSVDGLSGKHCFEFYWHAVKECPQYKKLGVFK